MIAYLEEDIVQGSQEISHNVEHMLPNVYVYRNLVFNILMNMWPTL